MVLRARHRGRKAFEPELAQPRKEQLEVLPPEGTEDDLGGTLGALPQHEREQEPGEIAVVQLADRGPSVDIVVHGPTLGTRRLAAFPDRGALLGERARRPSCRSSERMTGPANSICFCQPSASSHSNARCTICLLARTASGPAASTSFASSIATFSA